MTCLNNKEHSKKDKIAHQTLCKFIQVTLKNHVQVNLSQLVKELDCSESYKPESIRKWYLALTDCIPFLSLATNTQRQLWATIFERFRWDFPVTTLNAYVRFCVTLANNNGLAIKPILQSCVANFVQRKDNENESTKKINDNSTVSYSSIHSLIEQIYEFRSTISSQLFMICVDLFPSLMNEPDILECYMRQLLVIISYVPVLKEQILELLIEKITLMDVQLQKLIFQEQKEQNINDEQLLSISPTSVEDISDDDSDIEPKADDTDSDSDTDTDNEEVDMNEDSKGMDDQVKEVDEEEESLQSKSIACLLELSLDQMMCLLFDYVSIIKKQNEIQFTRLYQTLLRVFERCILSTNGTSCVQFLILYVCSFDQRIAEQFVSRLLNICTDTHRAVHERCFAAGYVGGFISKAKFLRHMSAFSTFDVLVQWLVAYATMYKQSNPFIQNMVPRHAKNYGLFYAVVQAVIKIYSYHQQTFDEMIESQSNTITNSIYEVCKSSLQPIKFCDPELVQQFLTAVNKSSLFDIEKFPVFSSSQNGAICDSCFTNWQLHPFDSKAILSQLSSSSAYLREMIRIHGQQSPYRNETNEDFEWVVSDMQPELALTPSMTNNNNSRDSDSGSDDDMMPVLNI